MSSPSAPGEVRPGSPSRTQTRKVQDRAEQAIAALAVEVPAVVAPPGYRVAMGLLVAWLVVISLVYAAVVAFFAYLFGWHVYQTFNEFALFHLPMAVVGGLLLLFLVKPLFLRAKGNETDVVALTAEQEPKLFAFVERLCEATGAPMPAVIEVDCEPNAAAKLDGFVSGRVVLRFGLPLVAALNARQFAGVLAHEFGHFSQRGGMRASTLVRILSGLFGRIVFQRDRLDAALLKLRLQPNPWPRMLYRVAAALIESARGVLWVMLVLSELFTCGALRRMEYDADCREANVAGVKDFIVVSKLLAFLSIAARRARHDLAQTWDDKRLADDFPRLVVLNARQLAEHRTDIIKLLEKQTTGWFDTHPCHADRVRNVEQLGPEGVYKTDATAKGLFADFEGLCRVATRTFYTGIVGDAMTGATLVPTAELVGQRLEDRKAFRSLHRFYQGRVIALRPVFPTPDAAAPAEDPHRTAEFLAEAREAMVYAAEEVAKAARDFDKSGALSSVHQAQLALCALFPNGNASVQRLRRQSTRELKRHEPRFVKAAQQLPSFESAARDRLTAAMQLLWTADPAALGQTPAEAAAMRKTAKELLTVCASLQAVLPMIVKLRDLSLRLRVFFGAYNPRQPYQPVVNHVLGTGRSAIDQMAKLRDTLAPYPYPFEHPTPGISIGAALVGPTSPDFHDPAATHAAIGATLDRFYTLTFRTLARLTGWAEQVEASLGFSQLAEPPDDEDEETKDELAREGRRKTRRYWIAYGSRALAGVAMLWALVWLSISPPSFGSWTSSRNGYRYERPASFRVPFQRSSYDSPPRWSPQQHQQPNWPSFMPTPPPPVTPNRSWSPPTFPKHQPAAPRYPGAFPGGGPSRGGGGPGRR